MRNNPELVGAQRALAGRPEAITVDRPHLTLGTSLSGPYPAGLEVAYFALGCFWGAERRFFELPGVYATAVGYQGGHTPNPTYREVCSGLTDHAESVRVVFDPTTVTYDDLLVRFFESHDPTQGNRQGADVGTQYRSVIFVDSPAQRASAEAARESYGERLRAAGYGAITTEIVDAGPFYLAEEYHQQYLVANPDGYCGLGGTGVACPVGPLSR
jgi:peptide-methionine (S)-S-oxide reductase